MKSTERQTPVRVITLGFMAMILIGSFLLILSVCVKPGVNFHYVDALFISASTVCVTGLVAMDTTDTYTVLSQTTIAFLVQVGGLGVTSVGMGVTLALGRRVNLKERLLMEEAMNLDSGKGIVCIVKNVLKATLCFEEAGVVLSYLTLSGDYPPLKALGINLFHLVAAFNNSGFDILGGLQNLIEYKDDILLSLTTSGLTISDGLGFLVIMGIAGERSSKRLCLHSKVVIVATPILLVVGTTLLWLIEDITWLGTFLTSASARTAGFTISPLSDLTTAGLLTVTVLMFVGVSLGSIGGGIKTSALSALFHIIKGAATSIRPHAFHYKIPQEVSYKTAIVTALSSLAVIPGILCMCVLEPGLPFKDVMLEVTSAFGTVGPSTSITPGLSPLSELLEVPIMYIGRFGSLTIVIIWIFKSDISASLPKGSIFIG